MDAFLYAFIPLFVAFDGGGLLPIFWTLTSRLAPSERRKAVREAVLTALAVTGVFLLVSKTLLSLMGISLEDIMVAGGGILIVICLKDLLWPPDVEDAGAPTVNPGVVPLGVPLLAGPAVLTTVLLVRDQHGWGITILSLITNLAVVWLTLRLSDRLLKLIGPEGSQVISKSFNLILTAYGVMLIRRGLVGMI